MQQLPCHGFWWVMVGSIHRFTCQEACFCIKHLSSLFDGEFNLCLIYYRTCNSVFCLAGIFLALHLTFYLAFYFDIWSDIYAAISSDAYSDIWHSVWHVFWQFIRHSIWHVFWHFYLAFNLTYIFNTLSCIVLRPGEATKSLLAHDRSNSTFPIPNSWPYLCHFWV